MELNVYKNVVMENMEINSLEPVNLVMPVVLNVSDLNKQNVMLVLPILDLFKVLVRANALLVNLFLMEFVLIVLDVLLVPNPPLIVYLVVLDNT